MDDVVTALREFCASHQRAPSYSELADLAGYASKQAAHRLAKRLIMAGWLGRDTTGRLFPTDALTGPRLLGSIQAGFPSPAEDLPSQAVSLDRFLIDKPLSTFLLTVSGDSMIDAGIHQGDLVVVERGATPKSGDIVVAHVDGEWTLKYYQRRNGAVQLVPANDKYPTILARCELTIGGVVRGVVRKYGA